MGNIKKAALTTILALTLVSVCGCGKTPDIDGSTDNDTTVSVSLEETEKLEADSGDAVKIEENEDIEEIKLSEDTYGIKVFQIEEPGTSDCNHRYEYGWLDTFFACTKCGYTPVEPYDEHDCKKDGHVAFNSYYYCVYCFESIDTNSADFKFVDYKPSTDDCDGIAQAVSARYHALMIYMIPCGHNHSNVPKDGGFGTYAYGGLEEVFNCLDGIYCFNNCSLCGEYVGRCLFSKTKNYHHSPVLIKEADPDDNTSLATLRCKMCNTEYTVPLPEKAALSGKADEEFVTKEYGYIEGEDFLVYLDKNLKLPGNFADITEKLIQGIRKETGLITDDFEFERYTCDMRDYLSEDVWQGIPQKNRIIINLIVDRKPVGWISCADTSSAICIEYELFDDEVWNSVPEYRDNPWRRHEYVDYGVIIHELTHAITLRSMPSEKLGSILSEGIAQYVGAVLDSEFAGMGIDGYHASTYYTYDQSNFSVTKESAESVFEKDYAYLTTAERGPEYDYGRYFCQFLNETYGSDFFLRIVEAFNEAEWGDSFIKNYWNDDSVKKDAGRIRTKAIKDEFGDDVFVKYGEWFQKNNG